MPLDCRMQPRGLARAGKRQCAAIVAYALAWLLHTFCNPCVTGGDCQVDKQRRPVLELADEVELCYTLIRQVGFVLDELSCQGLEVWQNENYLWKWRWIGTELCAARGFWALGEAVVDAVVARYPANFDTRRGRGEA